MAIAIEAWRASALDGDARIGNISADVDSSFSDIFDDLSWVLEGRLEARRNEWGFWVDGTLARLETDDRVGGVKIESKTDLTLAGVFLTRTIYQGPLGSGTERQLLVEATAGLIVTSIDTEIKVGAPLNAPARVVRTELSFDCVSKDRAEQPDRAPGRALAAGHTGHAPGAGLFFG